MNKKLIALFLLLLGTAYAQHKKISIEANYPILIDQNFMGKNYKGVADLGVKYRFLTVKQFQIGVGVSGSHYVNDGKPSPTFAKYEMKGYVLQPKVFAEYQNDHLKRLRASLALGYTFMNFKGSAATFEEQIPSIKESESGININLGLSYDLYKDLFGQIQYDFSKIKAKDGVPDVTYNTNINVLKVGLGYRF